MTLWRCASRAYIASERFLFPETDCLHFLVVKAARNPHPAGEGCFVLLAAILLWQGFKVRHLLLGLMAEAKMAD